MNDINRKEIIQVSGLSILVVMTLLGDFLIAGFIYKWHQHEVYRSEKKHLETMTDLLGEERKLKNQLVTLEGVAAWDDTSYMKTLPISR